MLTTLLKSRLRTIANQEIIMAERLQGFRKDLGVGVGTRKVGDALGLPRAKDPSAVVRGDLIWKYAAADNT